ncbi:/ / Regulator of chromosome condensation (RCC1) repeat protein / 245884:247278 Reverse [Candidatus Hepatoplasma crinochetorum]|uniref:/ / Regulator of chromosome condensation (RCC1) repeat protein / 245884:247278 Reverse n=1 Tax=Candidatus Hepatoplasma crinochetorum TaxID=295596 RepID=A0A0G7ZME5_9MOLU|nr:/ / Regulator of chromosome condensation (RCC1) repeat protein / 245884:247278 Reverse [Candidatus Hepatoplasma crinochetorum]
MKKYYMLFLIPLLGIVSLNSGIKINSQNKNIESEEASITDIATSEYSSGMIIDSDLNGFGDTLYMWGDNLLGQIPNQEENTIIYEPLLIDYDWDGNLIDLELNYGTSAITIDSDYDGYADTLYMWGNNDYGQIGNGESSTYKVPITKITPEGEDNWSGNIIDLQLGQNYSGVSIDTDLDNVADTLYMWGNNIFGQIGNGQNIETGATDVLYPIIITPENGRWNGTIEKFDLGYDTSGIIINNSRTGEDQLYMWGMSIFSTYGHYPAPYPVEVFPNSYKEYWGNLIDISFDNKNNGVINDSNNDGYGDEVYLWGENNDGELGSGGESERINFPTDNILTIEENIMNLEVNGKNSIITTDNNYDGLGDTIYLSGANDHGQIGNGSYNEGNILNPIKITPEGQDNWNGNILKTALGSNDIMLLLDQDNDGLGDTIYMWGSNESGQLGIGKSYEYSATPKIVFSTYY